MSRTTTPPDVLDEHTGRRYVHYDPTSDTRPSTAFVLAVADLQGVGPLDLPPLGYVTDPDALNRLVTENTNCEIDGTLTFEFAGFDVAVHPSGLAELTPVDGETGA